MPVEKRYSLFFNFSYLGLIQAANFLLSLIVVPYVVRIVGADGFGVIAVAQVLMFYLSVTIDYGFNRTAIRDVALYKEDREKISRIFSMVLVAKFLLCLLAFGALLILVLMVPLFSRHSLLYLLAFSFVAGQAVLVNWFFQGLEKMKFNAMSSLFSRLLFVALVFLFIREKGDEVYYIFFMGLGNVAAGLVSIFAVVRMYRLRWVKPSRSAILHEMKEGWPVTVSNLSMTTIQYIGIFILRLFTSDLVVGYYSIAEKVYFALKLMLDVFSQVAYPRVCRLMQDGMGRVTRFFRRAWLPFFGAVVIGCAGVFIFSPFIIHFLAGQNQDQPVLLLRVLCVAVIPVCLNIPACLVLLAGDHKKNYLRVFTVGTMVCILANVVLAPVWNAKGTVVAVLITEFLITAGLYREIYLVYRLHGLKEAWKQDPGRERE